MRSISRSKSTRRVPAPFALLLCPLIALNPVLAQTRSAALEPSAAEPLHVHLVESPDPVQLRMMSAKGYVVQVTNAAGAPVEGAAVALRLPEDGPTGRFANGLRAWVAYSDPAGIARFPVIQWGESAGAVEVRLTAAKGTLHTGLVVNQQIMAEAKSVMVIPVPAERASVAEPKPAPPPRPQVTVPTPDPATESPALADAVKPAPAAAMNQTTTGAQALHTLKPNPPASKDAQPSVSITNSPTGASRESHKKLYALLAVGAGAGLGTIFALKGHGGSGPSGSTAGLSVGTPTVSIGH